MSMLDKLKGGFETVKTKVEERQAGAPERAAKRKEAKEENRKEEIKKLRHKLDKEKLLEKISNKRTTRQKSDLDLQLKRSKLMEQKKKAMPNFNLTGMMGNGGFPRQPPPSSPKQNKYKKGLPPNPFQNW